ncbi:putative histone h1.3 [Aspergillus mulundensis]|uniref:Uncharacterized protein n=1 Tax=Aspergillus mulundensis TaxID=1810919 RepID=A0A3D8S507_9EURO|nr:hypothetical protein DSM5745_04939 [Aspergillus mulundensis]RDW81382.1 hypothetical protein DSM5745_04939 [Aspergillus mulundensis]
MATAGKGKPEGLLGLTQSEARLLLLGVLYTDGTGKVDFEKLAIKAPYKNVSSASSSYRQAKRRFLLANGVAEPSSASAQITPPKKAPAKRKSAAATPAPVDTDAVRGNDDDFVPEREEPVSPTPTPKPKRQRKTASKVQPQVIINNDPEREQDTYTTPTKPEQKQLEAELANSLKFESPFATRLEAWRAEERQIMADINVDAEFEEMERNRELAETMSDSAWLASLPDT